MISIVIPGRPIAKKRPRFARRKNYVAVIDDQKAEEGLFLWHLERQFGFLDEPISIAIAIKLRFYMPIPKATSKSKRGLMIEGLISHTKKPDLDNLIKFALDCLSQYGTFIDDAQVVEIAATKQYSAEPRTEIVIEQISF